ncbi:hypothetical protein QJS10_CPA01g01985 [Acorus calamus]|uniref:Uncharacterized protein n=1 Tax=Acorus calamus TaxID=4465 RepID=A0AAV9FIT6_ACOCL|nr:hypothetical protein QJS10_CPA01g01985 [Acorus calamus]
MFPRAEVRVLASRGSDHTPLMIDTDANPPPGRKPFRFEKFWAGYSELTNIIQQGWNCLITPGISPTGLIHQKLCNLRHKLQQWSKQVVGDLPSRAVLAEADVQQLLQSDQQGFFFGDYPCMMRVATNKLFALEHQLELFWAQRARQQRLQEGDRNTRFYKATVKNRRTRNRISNIVSETGAVYTNMEDIKNYVVSYFWDHWSSKMETLSEVPPDVFPRKLSSEWQRN